MWPVIFHCGGLTIYSYGLAIALGGALGGCLAWLLRPRGLFELTQYLSLCLLTTLGAGFGARWLGSIAASGDGTGGLSSLGVPLIVGPTILAYCRLSGLDYRRVFDYLMPFAIFGAAFQRTFGCFLAGCCRGEPTELPWGVNFPGSAVAVHPTQLYQGLGLFLIFFFLVGWHSATPGRKALLALASYGLVGLLVAPLRVGLGDPWWLGLTPYAWIHGLTAVACLAAAALLAPTPARFESVRV